MLIIILSPLDLLNTLEKQKLKSIFPNICIALRLFCTFPVSVAEAEMSFSTLARLKNFLRSTMVQDQLSSLALGYTCYGTYEYSCKSTRISLCYNIDIFANNFFLKNFVNNKINNN